MIWFTEKIGFYCGLRVHCQLEIIKFQRMESYSPERSVGSSVWGLQDPFRISSRSSPLTLNMSTENMRCAVCNQRNDTLVKREVIVWQREDIIHVREKELRERELLLQEKATQLKNEEMRLRDEEERLKKEYDSEESRKWKNFNMEEYVSFVLQKSDELKNDFFEDKERLLQNKEQVNLEKAKLLQTQELELLKKEQVLTDEKSIADKEKKLSDERNLSIENRENIVKALERTLHTKITDVLEKEKTLAEKMNLIEKKENALSVATEMMAKKESELHDRENSIIEKERNIIKQIYEFVSAVKSGEKDQVLKETEDMHIYFGKILNDKLPSLQQQENAIEQREKILEEKWKAYGDAQEHLKLQQEKIFEERNSCEKEKLMLKEWSQILQKQDEVMTKKINSFGTTLAEKSYQTLFANNNTSSDIFVRGKTEIETSRNSSPLLKLRTESENSSAICDHKPSADDVSVSWNVTVGSKYENSGEEFLKYFEKEKEELHNVLLSDKIEETTVEILNKSSEGNTSVKSVELKGTVKEFFDTASNISTTIRNDQIVTAGVSNPMFSSAINKSRTTKTNLICQEAAQNIAFVSDLGATKLRWGHESGVLPIQENCIPGFTEISSNGQEIDNSLLYGEAQGNVQNQERNDTEKTLKNELKINQDSVEIERDRSTVVNIREHKNSSECSAESNLNKQVEMDSSVKTYTEHSKSHDVNESVSSRSSPSSTRSLTSPIPEDKLKSSRTRRKKIERDSLLKAIASGNNLETVNLLNMNSLPLELRDDEGRSAFLLAVKMGNIELVKRLIKMGADVRASDYNGDSALHIAVSEKNSDIVMFLIKEGLNPHVTNNDGHTALELANETSDRHLVDAIRKLISPK